MTFSDEIVTYTIHISLVLSQLFENTLNLFNENVYALILEIETR